MADYYVDTDFTGGSNDGSESNPWVSLSTAISGLPTLTENTTIHMSGTAADTTGVIISSIAGTYKLTIVAVAGDKAGTSLDTNKYRLTAGHGRCIQIQDHNVEIDGLQLYTNLDYATTHSAVYISSFPSNAEITVKNCLIRDLNDRANYGAIAVLYTSGVSDITVNVFNNIIYDYGSTSLNGAVMCTEADVTINAYNNTVVDCYVGFSRTSGIFLAVNNIVFGANDSFSGTFDASSGYNAADEGSEGLIDTDLSGEAGSDIFNDYSGDDFAIISGSLVIGAGVGPSTDSNVPTTDIDGTTRSGTTCDIGADEYSSSGTSLLPIKFKRPQPIRSYGVYRNYTSIRTTNKLMSYVPSDVINLVIQNLSQSQSIDNLDLIQAFTLVINELTQNQTIDNLDLIQQNILEIQALLQSQEIDNLNLVQQNILNIDGISQNQLLDILNLIQQNLLVIEDISQNQEIDNLDLVQANVLVINDIDQQQNIDNIELITGFSLEIQSLSQNQSIDNTILTQANVLSIEDIAQIQNIDNITLSSAAILEIASLIQSQNIDVINLIQQNVLSIDGVLQTQSIDNLTLDTALFLQIANIIQSQSIDNLDLIQQSVLDINNLLQSQNIDNISFVTANGKVTVIFSLKAPSTNFNLETPSISFELN